MPLLSTRDLTAFYGDFQALYGIDLSFDAGETIAIIGANGAGKSTFLKAIAGLIPSRADSVVLDGHPIGRTVGPDAMKVDGWQRLLGDYATLLDVEPPRWNPGAGA